MSETVLASPEDGIGLIGADRDTLDRLKDPLIELARAMEPDFAWWKAQADALDAETQPLLREYRDFMKALKGKAWYPDADGTVRFTWGRARSYSPRDGVTFGLYTTLSGVTLKHTGEAPFDVPEKLRRLAAKREFGPYGENNLRGDVPVNFLVDLDISGGNSRSSVMNTRGRLVGHIFDKVDDALFADFHYCDEKNRAMVVDIRYTLFITENVAEALHILAELTLAGTSMDSPSDG